jgi:hypothetical protein
MRVVRDDADFRIIEVPDDAYGTMEDLKGDLFNVDHIGDMYPGMSVDELKQEEREFEAEVEREGVFGYVLQKWNADVGAGWEDVDSCYGFIGAYAENPNTPYHHYIVSELWTLK